MLNAGVRDSESELLERTDELETAARCVAAVAAGEGRLLTFEGPAGAGKTRLLDRTRRTASDRGMQVLAARGGELERDFAYGVVRQLLERTVATADRQVRARLLAGPARHGLRALALDDASSGRLADDQAFAVRHGLYWLVSNLAAIRPVLIAVDDAQWADAPSLRFLAYLARRLGGLPVLVALTVRSGEASSDDRVLGELLTDPAAERVRPAPLSEDAVTTMLGGAARVDPVFAAACHEATGGNPFLVTELRTALAADGIAPVAAHARRVAGLGPETVSHSLMLRLARASPHAPQFARAVAVLGSTADHRLAGLLAGLTETDCDEVARGLTRAAILAGSPPLRFAHPILRDAVYHDLSLTERETLHARAAALLQERSAPASEIAAHLLATSPSGSPDSALALREAARTALNQGAADLAARYLQRALQEPLEAEDRAVLLAELGRATWLAGEDPLGALELLREALGTTTDEELRPKLAIDLARATFSTGNAPEAGAVVDGELSRTVERPREVLLTLEAEHGSIQLLHDAGPACGRRIMGFADLPGETDAELLVLSNVATWLWLGGTADEAAGYAERSLGGGRAVAAAGSDSIAVLQAAWVLGYAERHDLAAATIAATAQDAARTGSVFGLTASCTMAAMLAYRAGDVAHAEAEARRGLSVPGIPPFVHPMLHAFLVLPLVEVGALDEADEVIARSWVGEHLPRLVQMNTAFWALGRLRAAQGRHAEAMEAFLSGLERDRTLHADNPGVPWRLDAARSALALGDHDRASRLVAEHEPHARRWGTAGAVGAWLHAAGCVEPAAEPAHDLLARAVETLSTAPAKLDHAKALVDLGARKRRDGLRQDARAILQDGLDAARACGAKVLVQRAHEELLVAGARPRRLQFSGADALTASERRVCELAALGRTNREIAQELFVTPKTVENHLGRAYAKLGIASRDALADALGGDPQGRPQGEDEGLPLMT